MGMLDVVLDSAAPLWNATALRVAALPGKPSSRTIGQWLSRSSNME